jgi:glycosyltransferase involved in cell wall biosynthesis
MKAMIVSNTSLTIRNFRTGLMQLLQTEGYNVVFCAQDNGYAEEVSSKGFTYFPLTLDRKGTNFITDLRLILSFYKLYIDEKPDIILHYTIKPNVYGSIAANLAGIPCINTITGLGYVFIKKSSVHYLVRFLYKTSCILAKRTFFQNKDDMNLFLKLGLITKKKAILVNGSGVNTAFFDPNFCRSVKKKEGLFVFLFTGRILWDKGVRELVEAARLTKQKYPTAQFWLAGIIDSGNPAGICEGMVRDWEKEGTITYYGEVKDIRPFICKADCVVLPSYREGIPRSLLEALAMEKPIITTNTVGCQDVVEDGVNGFAVPTKDSMALFDSFCRMLELSPEIRLRMGKAGRDKVKKNFEETIIINRYLKEIQKVLS